MRRRPRPEVDVNTGGYAEGDNLTSIEAVTGSDYADTLTSGIISTLKGGYGDDLYVVTGTGVTIAEALNGNTDEVRTTLAAYNLATSAANVENLTYTGTAAFTGTGNTSDNVITGGTGADYLAGAAGADQLVGGGGNDVILGGDGADVLSGEAGNDALSGGDGADQFFGGSGSDTVNYDDATGAVTIDLLWGLSTGFAAGDSFTEVEAIRGSNYADTFVSNGAANTLNGGAGTDVVDYSGSNAVNVNLNTNLNTGGYAEGDNLTAIEVVIGSDYADTLTSGVLSTLKGGYGDDVYVVTASGVTVAEATNGNTDEIRTTLAAYTLATAAANVENLTYTGAAAFTGTGNALDNLLTGGAGNDSLSGGAGTDVLAGGAGSDTLLGGDGADQFIGGTGIDLVSYADSSAAVTLDLNAGTLSGYGAGDTFLDIEGFVGTNRADTFIESADAHIIDGGLASDEVSYEAATSSIGLNLASNAGTGFAAGDVLKNIEFIRGSGFDDSLTGNTGDNMFAGGGGADQIDGGAGTDRATYGRSSAGVWVDLLAGTATGGDAGGDVLTNIEQLQGSSYDDTLTGNVQANYLFGLDGNDLIDGGDGDDTIYGGLNSALVSSDTLRGGNGNDTFTSNPGADSGSIIYGDAGNDSIESWDATVHGGDGNDYLQNFGYTGLLYGEEGLDTFDLHGFSQADGGDNGDTYNINSTNRATVQDSGAVGTDLVKLNFIARRSDVGTLRIGNDLYVSTATDVIDGEAVSGVLIPNWFVHKSVELFQAADGVQFTL